MSLSTAFWHNFIPTLHLSSNAVTDRQISREWARNGHCTSALTGCHCACTPCESWCMSRALLGTKWHFNGNLREQHHGREKAASAGHARQPCEGCAHGQVVPKARVVVGILGATWGSCRNTAMENFGLGPFLVTTLVKSQVSLSLSAKQGVLGLLSGLNSRCP